MEEYILNLVATLAPQYPIISSILMVVGVARLVFKPFMSFVHMFVATTPTTWDDEKLAAAEASKYYKAFVWVLDYLTSIKLPLPGIKVPVEEPK